MKKIYLNLKNINMQIMKLIRMIKKEKDKIKIK